MKSPQNPHIENHREKEGNDYHKNQDNGDFSSRRRNTGASTVLAMF